MTKPLSIKIFDVVYFVSVALSLYEIAFIGLPGDEFDRTEMAISLLAIVALSGAVWFLISQRASNMMRWFYIVLAFIGLLVTAYTFAETVTWGLWAVAVSVTIAILDLVCAALLLRKDVRPWFASKGRLGEVDAQVFD